MSGFTQVTLTLSKERRTSSSSVAPQATLALSSQRKLNSVTLDHVGKPGPVGNTGAGVPNAGSTGQVLRKISDTNQDTEWHTPSKADISLDQVNNTADADKPISTAAQAALDAKQPLDSGLTAIAALDSSTSGVAASDGAGWIKKTYAQLKTALSLVKGDVGLGNVDNTADASKPVSTAQQTAIDAKVENAITAGHTTVAPSGDAVNTALATKPTAVLDVDGTLVANSDLRVASQKATKTYVDTGLAAKQNSLGFTAENVANKSTTTTLGTSDTLYPTQNAVKSYVDTTVASYVPVTRTVNGHALSANVTVYASDVGLGSVTNDAQLKAADLDNDTTLAANSATKVPSQHAVKAYVDGSIIAAGSGDVVGPSSSVDSEIALFNSTTGKLLKRASISGLAKLASGVLSAAAQGSDYYAPGGTDVAVADGGTGSSTASGARTNLGLVIGTDIQAHSANLDTFAGKTPPSGAVVGNSDTQSLTNKTINDATNTVGPLGLGRIVAAGQMVISSTGNTVVTGLGFQPRVILMTASIVNSSNACYSSGFYDRVAGTTGSLTTNAQTGSLKSTSSSSTIISTEAPIATVLCRGTISATSSDGFTFNCATWSAATTVINWVAYA